MIGLATSLIPIELFSANSVNDILCKSKMLLKASDFDFIHCADINSPIKSCFEIEPSQGIERIFVLVANTSILIAINWKINSDKYELVNTILHIRNKTVKRIVQAHKSVCLPLNQFIETICQYQEASINYSFLFTSILAESMSNLEFAKVLALPSILDGDDMISTSLKEEVYSKSTKISKKLLEDVRNYDFKPNWETYITWASVVTVTNSSYEELLQNHLFILLLETSLQTNWNKCYSYNQTIDKTIKAFDEKKVKFRDVSKIRIDAYRALIDSKNVTSATYSSRINNIFNAMIKTSDIMVQIEELEQKLGFLQLYIENRLNYDNEKLQKSTEILLFIIAIPQIAQMFINLPVLENNLIGYLIIGIITVIGIIIISKKRI